MDSNTPNSVSGSDPRPSDAGAALGGTDQDSQNSVKAVAFAPPLNLRNGESDGVGARNSTGSNRKSSPGSPLAKMVPLADISISQQIGSGSFAKVFLGQFNEQQVAVKKMRLRFPTERVCKEFVRDSSAMAACQHVNILKLVAVCPDEHELALVYEHMPQGSLFRCLHSSRLMSWPNRLNLALEIASGLKYLHDHGIVHGNLKSSNVLLTEQLIPKLADFGQGLIRAETAATGSGRDVTVRWQAPELFKRGGIASKSSDIYSLGIILWELASRTLPFAELASEASVASWVMNNPAQREKIPAECPQGLASIIKRCWSTRPQKRPDIAEVVESLRKLTWRRTSVRVDTFSFNPEDLKQFEDEQAATASSQQPTQQAEDSGSDDEQLIPKEEVVSSDEESESALHKMEDTKQHKPETQTKSKQPPSKNTEESEETEESSEEEPEISSPKGGEERAGESSEEDKVWVAPLPTEQPVVPPKQSSHVAHKETKHKRYTTSEESEDSDAELGEGDEEEGDDDDEDEAPAPSVRIEGIIRREVKTMMGFKKKRQSHWAVLENDTITIYEEFTWDAKTILTVITTKNANFWEEGNNIMVSYKNSSKGKSISEEWSVMDRKMWMEALLKSKALSNGNFD